MKKRILLLTCFILTITCYAQLGIGTVSPNGMLEISSGSQASSGLVLPIVAKLEDVENAIAGESVKRGTIIFDKQRNTLCYKKIDGWNCFNGDVVPDALYIKASNTDNGDLFGISMALSVDGNTLAVGAYGERSNTTGINGNQNNNSALYSGAVYIFTRNGTTWTQQAYIKASNTDATDNFGWALALSGDGNTLAVGAYGEDSNATNINGDQTNNSATNAGAVYVFTRSGTTWAQQAYIKASNSDAGDQFGYAIKISADGNTLAVGAFLESSNSTIINGDQTNNSTTNAGAVYVFTRSGTTWAQQAYIKASNSGNADYFGQSIALSVEGNTLVVGANGESSNTTGINGNQNNNSAVFSGAVYVFTRNGTSWTQQAYIKASNSNGNDQFGTVIKLSDDGNTLAVGANGESSNATGINAVQNNNSAANAGAVYIFTRSGTIWTQQAYIKASNTDANDNFGYTISLSGDGNTLAVGAYGEDSNATNINGDQTNNSATNAGAVYVFTRSVNVWNQIFYIKAPNTDANDQFGWSVALSPNGNTLTIGANEEASNATGIGGDQFNNSLYSAGAVYVYKIR